MHSLVRHGLLLPPFHRRRKLRHRSGVTGHGRLLRRPSCLLEKPCSVDSVLDLSCPRHFSISAVVTDLVLFRVVQSQCVGVLLYIQVI